MEYLEYSEENILERVDEYSLYCFYMGYEPLIGKRYPSPIRPGDDNPSFNIFERVYGDRTYVEFLWKDLGTSLRGPLDIFDMIMYQFGLAGKRQAMWKVCADFGLGGAEPDADGGTSNHLKLVEPSYMDPIHIKIVSQNHTKRDLLYWNQFNVNQQILREFDTRSIEAYFLTEGQAIPSYPKGGLGYAYVVNGKYQLYFPMCMDRKRRWRNDWNDTCVFGFKQLPAKGELCIITKAPKDVMCLKSLEFASVTPRGENIMLPDACIKNLKQRFKRVVTLFDNDGKHMAKHYKCEEIHIPLSTGFKDPTDHCSALGPIKTKELLNDILWI